MQQKISDSSEHPDSPDMHHNEAYGYADPAQLRKVPGIHGDRTEITSVCSDQMNVAASISHIETEPEYSSIGVPVSSKSHQVASKFKARRSFAGENFLARSRMKMQKRFSIDYNKLEHHTGTQPWDAIHSSFEQGTMTIDRTTTSPLEQKLVISKKVDVGDTAALPLMQPTHKSQPEFSHLSLPLHKGHYDTYQQTQHNQEHEQTLAALGEPGSMKQEKKISIPTVQVDQEPSDDSNDPLPSSKYTQICIYHLPRIW